MWSVLKNYADGAILFFRLTLGTLFIYLHGWPMLAGGLAKWRVIGGAMRHVGITMGPGVWGFLAACSESLGCLLIIIGFAFRPSCLLLFLTLTVAAISDDRTGGLHHADHAIEMALVFFTFMFIGPGKFSLDKG
jgi:putative oxidoreductase